MSDGSLRIHGGHERAFRGFLAQRSLRYACCAECGCALAYAQRLCAAHPRASIQWRAATGRATLHSFAVYRVGYDAGFPPPYTVAVAELEEGPRLVARVAESSRPPRIGCRLDANFDAAGRLFFQTTEEGDKDD